MRRIQLIGFGCAIVLPLAGCYTLQPAGGIAPQVGAEAAFDVNDAGRVALGGSMGPEIAQIEGRLVSRDSGEYLVAVNAVRLLRGGEQVWRGENVRIKQEHVSTMYLRKFSRGRTIALGALGVGAVVVLGSQGILVPFPGSDNPRTPPDSGLAVRIPRP